MSIETAECDPTEKTLYTEPYSDDIGTWNDRLYQTGSGVRKGIGIDVAGKVYVLPLKKWHELAEKQDVLSTNKFEDENEIIVEQRKQIQAEQQKNKELESKSKSEYIIKTECQKAIVNLQNENKELKRNLEWARESLAYIKICFKAEKFDGEYVGIFKGEYEDGCVRLVEAISKLTDTEQGKK